MSADTYEPSCRSASLVGNVDVASVPAHVIDAPMGLDTELGTVRADERDYLLCWRSSSAMLLYQLFGSGRVAEVVLGDCR